MKSMMVGFKWDHAVRQAGQGVTTGYSLRVNYPWLFSIEDDPKELRNINNKSSWASVPMTKMLTHGRCDRLDPPY